MGHSHSISVGGGAKNFCRAAVSFPHQGPAPSLFGALDAGEIKLVRRVFAAAQTPFLKQLAACATRCGNGWLYVFLAVLAPAVGGSRSVPFLAAGLGSAALSSLLYKIIKHALARPRPCDYDPALRSPVKTLDRYSFPSGHCMNAAAVAVPFGLTFPAAAFAVVLVWLLIAWSRLSLGHHYLSDVLCGGLLGVGVSLLVTQFLGSF